MIGRADDPSVHHEVNGRTDCRHRTFTLQTVGISPPLSDLTANPRNPRADLGAGLLSGHSVSGGPHHASRWPTNLHSGHTQVRAAGKEMSQTSSDVTRTLPTNRSREAEGNAGSSLIAVVLTQVRARQWIWSPEGVTPTLRACSSRPIASVGWPAHLLPSRAYALAVQMRGNRALSALSILLASVMRSRTVARRFGGST